MILAIYRYRFDLRLNDPCCRIVATLNFTVAGTSYLSDWYGGQVHFT